VGLLRGPVLFIVNPAARRAARLEALAHRGFRTAGIPYDVRRTESSGHADEIARQHAGDYEAVFVLGGDGTAIEVLDALAGTGKPVGILPGGTGNLVAHSLHIPHRVDRAVMALAAGSRATYDLGVLGDGRHFAFTAGAGLDARMIAETSTAAKRRLGVAAYIHRATVIALSPRPFHVRAEVEGELVEREALAVMVANLGTVFDNVLALGPGIRPDDGMLDLCIYTARRAGEALRLAWRLLRKDFREDGAITYRRGRSFRITCDPPQTLQADGEIRGMTPYTATVAPGAALVLVPSPSVDP